MPVGYAFEYKFCFFVLSSRIRLLSFLLFCEKEAVIFQFKHLGVLDIEKAVLGIS